MSADSTTRASRPILPGGRVGIVGGAPLRRWVRRLAVVAALVGVAGVVRERKLAENAKRFGLPG